HRPDGQSSCGVEVSGHAPGAVQEIANGSTAIPALICVLGIVHPGGKIREIGTQVKQVNPVEQADASYPGNRQCTRPFHRSMGTPVQTQGHVVLLRSALWRSLR